MAFYQGPVPIDDESYVERKVIEQVCGELLNRRWVLFLGPRQIGKTTALIRVKINIEDAGIPCVYVDLQQQPPFDSYINFINWFVGKVAEQLGKNIEQDQALEDLQAGLNNVLDQSAGRVVILVDEASNIPRDNWRNSFFGQLRGMSSARAFLEETDASRRLTFLFAGTFRPETLIDAANSPFNVCEKIEIGDLTRDEVSELTTRTLGEREDIESIEAEIYGAVGGQPYLVQRILGRALDSDSCIDGISLAISELRLGQTDHIANLFSRYLADSKLARLVSQLAKLGELDNSPADPNYAFLCAGGIAKRDGTKIVFRNSVYGEVARRSPQIGNIEVAVENKAPIFPLRLESFQVVSDTRLSEIAYSAQRGAVASYMSDSNRLALAGYGCSIEAILIDFLSGKTENERRNAGRQKSCHLNRYEDYASAESLRLVNLVKIASQLLGSNAEVPPSLREWRNLIHPSVAIEDYMHDSVLAPEVRAAAALHEIFLRDLPVSDDDA